ncbi:DNA-directed primase/polymerase protein [Euphorbia peplus]|nr:DNA-directed primase/polymerase protein [Euphorbia peplus]
MSSDDVDRLFNCFKCGISPPQSAVRERKRSKSKFKQGSGVDEVPSVSGSPSSGSAARAKKKNAIDAPIAMGKLGSNTVKVNSLSCGKQISPIVFYGSPHGVPPKRPISLLRLLNEIRIDLAEEKKSDLRKEVWATFPRQNEALNFAKEHVDVHVFSYQDHHNGQRRFLVSTYGEFWRRYKNMDPKFRHHYEVIQEGSPCHLYFDLEFDKRENQEKNGDQMVDLLISVIFEAFLEKYSIQGNDEWIVELDSSTAEKFSRHLIFRIPGTAFKDNSHAGAFVSEICSRISSARERYDRFGELYILKDSSADSSSQLFVDNAVYSRNRVFRLALSSKAGKTAVLVPTGRFKCKDMLEEDMFKASLICNMDADCKKLLVCKIDLDCVKTLHFETEENYYSRRCNYTQANDTSTTYEMGKSPFPSLDKFVESIASIGSVSGKIRSWYWFSEYRLIVYSMSRNRYCERIGREHKSNHVIYVVDLRRAFYYQKCHDPECQGYRSPSRPIPIYLIPDEMTNSNLGCQYADNGCERVLLYNDGNNMEGCGQDSWWLEAIRVADDVECKQKTMELGNMNIDEDDDDWWMAVERTASQAEVTYLN